MKNTIKEFFERENEKYQKIVHSDTNGFRLVDNLIKEILFLKKDIHSNEDPNVMLNKLASTFDSLERRILEANFKVNSSRGEALARVIAIKDCYQLLEEEEEIEKLRKEKLDNIEKEIQAGKDHEKDRREIGTRPEKIKDVRAVKAKLLEKEESKNIT